MNYAEIKFCDIANGEGVRTSLFVSGCRHCCPGCFNECAWDFSYGKAYTIETENEIIESLKPGYIKGLTLLGGEPFEPENQGELLRLLERVRSELPDKDIWCYSGFTFEELMGGHNIESASEGGVSRGATVVAREILKLLDVLVDGRFVLEKKDISLQFRGSSNQRIINVQETLKQGEIVPWKAV